MFRQWLGADRGISEEEWKTLIEEDEAFDNEIYGVGREEVNVEHDIGTEPTCVYCSQSHPSLSCQTVREPEERKQMLHTSGRCFVCLRRNHHQVAVQPVTENITRASAPHRPQVTQLL